MPLPYESVAQAIRNGQVAPAYVLAGPDGLQGDEVLAALRARIPAIGEQRCQGATMAPSEVVGALRSLSLAPGRLVVVDDPPWIVAPARGEAGEEPEEKAEKKPKAPPEQPLLDYLDHPLAGVTLVLRTSQPADKRRRLVKRVAEKGVLLETVAPKDNGPWLRQRREALDLRLSADLFALVAQRLRNADCGRMDSELRKLLAYGQGLGREAVDALIPASPEERIYDLVDAALAGEARTAYAAATSLQAQGEPVPRLLYSLGSQLRTIVQVAAACRGGGRPEAVAGGLSLHPYVARKAYDQSRRLRDTAIAAAMEAVWEAEAGFKSGRFEEGVALDLALMGILAAVGAPR